MNGLLPPSIIFHGRPWSTEALTGMAAGWRDVLDKEFQASGRPIAMVMANHPDLVALLFALSCFPSPLILLPLDLRPWRSSPPLPADTRLVLLSVQQHLEADARSLGFDVTILPDPDEARVSPNEPAFMTMPGLVLFTSGSTGRPRPVYRSTPAALSMARTLMGTVGLSRGSGVIATLPLARAFGLNLGLFAAAVLEAPLALLERFDHNALLRLFASQKYQCWAGTPMMADVLSRCPLPGPHPAPPVCLIGGHVSADLARRFKERFGVPLRSYYGTTETGSISVDGALGVEVRAGTAGRPVPGVELCIGDPGTPHPAGMLGQIWISSPRCLTEGYGSPPDLEPPETVHGWWPSPDVGSLDEGGFLTIAGRLDDCFRTAAGYLINPGAVAAALENFRGVTDTAVVPLETTTGPVLGVLVESATPLSTVDLRNHLLRSVPRWSQPRIVETTDALPRLASGRVDRRACITLLATSLARSVR